MTATGHNDRTTAIVDQIRKQNTVRELTRVEAQPADVPDLRPAIANLAARVQVLEDNPEPLIPHYPDNSNERVIIPQGISEMAERMVELAQAVEEIETGMSAISIQVTESGVTELAVEFSDMTATVMKMFSMLQQEQDLVRRRVNKINDDMTDFMDGLKEWTAREKQRA